MASRVGRRSAGVASSRAGSSRANRAGPGAGSSSPNTGNPPPTSSVSNVSIEPRHRAVTASPRRTASRHASTAPSCEPTCRWMPRDRSGPSGPPPRSMASAISISVIPNFEPPAPTARPGWVSGATSGLSRYRTSRRGAAIRRAIEASAAASSGDSSDTQRSGRPSRAARDRGPQVRVGLADPLQRDPIVRDAGPGRRRPFAARDDVRAQVPCSRRGRDDRRHVVRLDRVLAQPRIRERGAQVGDGRLQAWPDP